MRSLIANPTGRTYRFAQALQSILIHAWRRLTRRRWAVTATLALIAPVSSGCIAFEAPYLHSTSYVTPLVVTPRPAPHEGAIVAVKVEDTRLNVATYEVGAKYNPTWGGYEASTIDLKDKASLADQIAQDVLVALREQGFRAQSAHDLPGADADVRLVIRIDMFSMRWPGALGVQLDGLLLIEVMRPGLSRPWTDAVGARFEVPASLYPSDDEFQKCFERLYVTLRDKMRERLRAGLPP